MVVGSHNELQQLGSVGLQCWPEERHTTSLRTLGTSSCSLSRHTSSNLLQPACLCVHILEKLVSCRSRRMPHTQATHHELFLSLRPQ